MTRIIPDFSRAIQLSRKELLQWGSLVHSKYWQGLDISTKKEAEMVEILNWSFGVIISTGMTLESLRQQIKPNLPWADLHFEQERVGGQPLNPGETWKQWPYANSADKHRTAGEQFNHTYAERFWPKYAGLTNGGSFLPGRFQWSYPGGIIHRMQVFGMNTPISTML